jgi:1-acyl-sn-glycerol-3-phosphate acyltransferase
VAETNDYRSIVVASQFVTWLAGQLLKLGFRSEMYRPAGLFEQGPERCLILAPTHQSLLDPWLIMGALRYRQWRMLMPVRMLATQTFRRAPARWLTPLIRFFYRVEGVIALPPKEEGGTLPEKVQGLLDALREGDVVAIFPEGSLGKKDRPPVDEFAPGVVYLQRRSGARIVPMAVWMSDRRWPRRRYIIEVGNPVHIPDSLDLEAGAAWLRERTLELYERASRRSSCGADLLDRRSLGGGGQVRGGVDRR